MRTILVSALAILACACATAGRHGETATLSPGQVRTPSGLVYETAAEGSGPAARPGQTVRIHETLTLPDGKLVFTSQGREPIRFVLGAGQVIAGVDEGVTGMRVGGRRKLVVPPSLSERTLPADVIPPGSVLHYDVELVAIEGTP